MKVTLLAGGVGGAKLADGFQRALAPGDLTVIVNVADDMTHLGLYICPDLDTVTYTLAGLVNEETGWGLADETWTAFEFLERYGAPTWFRLGDGDIATHLNRTELLNEGHTLTDVTSRLARTLGVPSTIVPATNHALRTMIQTDDGPLEFQDYFVRRQQRDEVRGIELRGVERAEPTPEALNALREAELIVIAPSNPLVSIGPILAVPGLRAAVEEADAPKVAVSPIVAGKALKGPADRMLASLGHEPSAVGVARIYAGLIDRLIIDEADAELAPRIAELGMDVDVLPTVMRGVADREALARAILAR